MDDRDITNRLRAAGATELALDVTLRPNQTDPLAATALASDARPISVPGHVRDLPRITIDLRRAEDMPGMVEGAEADLEVVEVLGEGGMGMVYVAHQHSLARQVALKVPHRGSSSAEARALVQEGVIAGQLEHPGIVPVHALGLDGEGRPALVMKLIEGVAWDELLDDPEHPGWEGWPGSPENRRPGHLEVLARVCDAMRFAHSRAIVHRDLKPQNILIGRFGDVYVADWGVATPMGEGARAGLCGTLGYMAPEMALGEPVDERTDVYLLGAILHEVLTGRLRHEAKSANEALELAAVSSPHAYQVSDQSLGAIANRACHRDPAERFPNIEAFRDALLADQRHAASRRIVESTLERVAKAEAIGRLERPDDHERRRFERATIEARFGLDQAREHWPDNPDLPTLEARLEALLDTQRERAAALEELAHQRDSTVGRRQRAMAMGLLAVLAVVLSAFGLSSDAPVTTGTLLAFAAAVVVVVAGVTWRWWRDMTGNAFSRQALSVILVYCAYMFLHRVLAHAIGADPTDVVTRDAFAATTLLILGGFVVLRWVLILGVMYGVAAGCMVVWPARAFAIFAVTTAGAVVVAAFFAAREAKSERPS